jgi:hypothetical protein
MEVRRSRWWRSGDARVADTVGGDAGDCRRSGGDALQVEDASAFETTLTRIRQRYALHFNAEGAESSRDVEVEIHWPMQRGGGTRGRRFGIGG